MRPITAELVELIPEHIIHYKSTRIDDVRYGRHIPSCAGYSNLIECTILLRVTIFVLKTSGRSSHKDLCIRNDL